MSEPENKAWTCSACGAMIASSEQDCPLCALLRPPVEGHGGEVVTRVNAKAWGRQECTTCEGEGRTPDKRICESCLLEHLGGREDRLDRAEAIVRELATCHCKEGNYVSCRGCLPCQARAHMEESR